MKQKAVVVKVNLIDGDLNAGALNELFADGWQHVATAESTPGSVLVIVQKEDG